MHTIRLVNGPETINLNGSAAGTTWVLDYVPNTPNVSTIDFVPEALRDGGERISTTRRNVSESMDVSLTASSRDAMIASLNQIEAMFRRAEEYQARRVGSPTYLEMQPDGAASMYRSEILSGKLQPGNDTLGFEWRNRRVTTTLFMTRRYYWEGPERELPLSNPMSTTYATGGKTIYNFADEGASTTRLFCEGAVIAAAASAGSWSGTLTYSPCNNAVEFDWLSPCGLMFASASGASLLGTWTYRWLPTSSMGTINVGTRAWTLDPCPNCLPVDGTDILATYVTATACPSHANWVAIAGSDVLGAIPTPPRLEISNSYSVTNRSYSLRVGINAFSTPASALFMLEAESATMSVTASNVIGKTFSASAAKSLYVPPASARVMKWKLTGCALDAYQGMYFQILGRLTYVGAGMPYGKLQLMFPYDTPLTLLSETKERPLTDLGYQDFGTLRLPPWVPGASGYMELALCLNTRTVTGSQAMIVIDCLHLLPTDSWRYYEPAGWGLNYNARLVDDGPRGILYTDNWSPTGLIGHYTAYGAPLQIWPGRDHRVFFLWTNSYGLTEIDRTSTVRLYYRPRKLTI